MTISAHRLFAGRDSGATTDTLSPYHPTPHPQPCGLPDQLQNTTTEHQSGYGKYPKKQEEKKEI
jgi:hypothetical protein